MRATKHKAIASMVALLTLAGCGGGRPDAGAGNAAVGAYGTSTQGCLRFLVGGKPPIIANPAANQGARTLCNRSFVAHYSSATRTPLWVAEYLTEAGLRVRNGIARVDDFHEDDRVKDGPRLADYRGSGYDRGHLAPDADMPSREAAEEAFALTNIAPEMAGLNRRSWADLEKSVRRQTRGGAVHVVTGVLFSGRLRATHDDGRVKVPTTWFKAVYAVGRGATAFTATNEERPHWDSMTISQFATVHGIDPFPGLEAKYRTVNGARDGSMERLAGDAKASGRGPAGTPGTRTTVHDPDNELIHDPANGQYISRGDYRRKYRRDAEPNLR